MANKQLADICQALGFDKFIITSKTEVRHVVVVVVVVVIVVYMAVCYCFRRWNSPLK